MTSSEVRPLHVGIVGGTFTGNRGAQAMLAVCIQQMRVRFPGCVIHVMTYYPAEDGKQNLDADVFIHSATPFQLVANWVPSFFWVRLFGGRNGAPGKVDRLGFGQLAKLDLVLDVAGVSYIDGREKFLPYNVLTSFPFSLMGVPYFKLSQAIGPVSSVPNRFCAKLALARVTRIFARGALTASYLKDVFPNARNLDRAADLAFLLEPSKRVDPVAERPRRVGIVASSLVMSQNDGYIPLLAKLCLKLLDAKWNVVLIAHSWREGSSQLRNNDLPALDAICSYDERLGELRKVGEGLGAAELKSEIGSCRVVLTSRFHGMIAALSTATPVVVAGWSHKYREVMAAFGLEQFCLPHNKADVASLLCKIEELDSRAESISDEIEEKLPGIRKDSSAQFDQIVSLLGGLDS